LLAIVLLSGRHDDAVDVECQAREPRDRERRRPLVVREQRCLASSAPTPEETVRSILEHPGEAVVREG
jgi:hypothetical protein